MIEEDNLLRSGKEEGSTVTIRNRHTDKEKEARVAKEGIVRQSDGPAAYCAAVYEIVEDE